MLFRSNDSKKQFYLTQFGTLLRRTPLQFLKVLGLLLSKRLTLTMQPLHDPHVVEWLESHRFWIGLHCMGVIYKPSVLNSFELGCLNSHIGLLPEYRGRSVMEWSLLTGAPTGITVFFMDGGIDTGAQVLLRREVGVEGKTDNLGAKEVLFHSDGVMYRDALRQIIQPGFQPLLNDGTGKRFYVMSHLLVSVVNTLLQEKKS